MPAAMSEEKHLFSQAKGLGKFVRYIKVLFHTFYCNFGQAGRSLYRGLCYVEVW